MKKKDVARGIAIEHVLEILRKSVDMDHAEFAFAIAKSLGAEEYKGENVFVDIVSQEQKATSSSIIEEIKKHQDGKYEGKEKEGVSYRQSKAATEILRSIHNGDFYMHEGLTLMVVCMCLIIASTRNKEIKPKKLILSMKLDGKEILQVNEYDLDRFDLSKI